jgi:predicted acetyltransferase
MHVADQSCESRATVSVVCKEGNASTRSSIDHNSGALAAAHHDPKGVARASVHLLLIDDRRS